MTQRMYATKTPSGHYSTFGESNEEVIAKELMEANYSGHGHNKRRTWDYMLSLGWTVGPVTVTDGHDTSEFQSPKPTGRIISESEE